MRLSSSLLLLVAAMCGAASVRAAETPFDALVAAERAFAVAAQRDLNRAFVDAAGEHGVVFRPDPVRAADIYGNAPPAEYRLEWAPAQAEIAPSGDLGYTFGPFVYTAATGVGHGHYFSVWARDRREDFHFVSDIGVSHAAVPMPADVIRRGARADSASTLGRSERDERMDALRELDSALIGRLRRESPAAVYASVGADDLVLLRDNSLPLSAPFDDAALRATDLGDAVQINAAERISADGTLASTHAAPADGRGARWVRVWRYGADGWKLAVDLTLPASPAPGGE